MVVEQCRSRARVATRSTRTTTTNTVCMSRFQETDIDEGQEREDPDDCGACMVSRAETRTDAANWCEKACWWKWWQIGYELTEARNVAQIWSSLVLRFKLLEKVVERSSHKARLTELNMSDETFPKDDHHGTLRFRWLNRLIGGNWHLRDHHRQLVWRSSLWVMKRSRSVWLQLERNVICIPCTTSEDVFSPMPPSEGLKMLVPDWMRTPLEMTWCKSFQDNDHDVSWWALLNEVQQRGVHVRWLQWEVAFVIESTQHVYVRKERSSRPHARMFKSQVESERVYWFWQPVSSVSGTHGDKPNDVWSDLKHVRTHEYTGNAYLVAQKARLVMPLPWRKEMTLKRVVETTWWSSRESRCSRLNTSAEYWTIPVVPENGNFYCHERPVCYWSPWRQNWAGSMEWTAAVIPKEKLALKSLDLVDETRAKWPWRKIKQPGKGPENPWTKKSKANSRRVIRGETRGSTTRGEERNTVLQVREQLQVGQRQQRREVWPRRVEHDCQRRPEGKLSQSEAESFRAGLIRPVNTESRSQIRQGEDVEELTTKGLNYQDGEVLIPIKSTWSNVGWCGWWQGRTQTSAGSRVSEMNADDRETKRVNADGFDGQNCMLGYLGRIIDDHGPDAWRNGRSKLIC